MPRCFLAKSKKNMHNRWEENNNSNVENLHLSNNHRSTVGSISAAVAVRSIQEPLNINNNNHNHLNKLAYNLSRKETEALEAKENENLGDSPKHHPSSGFQERIFYGVPIEETTNRPACHGITSPTSPAIPPSITNRVRTKEETDAAHDLLELSRSLPPLPRPTAALHNSQLQPIIHPPTPPTPEDSPVTTTTLIYITGQTNNNNSNHTNIRDYPLTPPIEQINRRLDVVNNNTATSGEEDKALYSPESPSEPKLSIIDGRTKKSKDPSHSERGEKSKYTCSECGKNYATSSNLSRHKQTHRSLDSTNAKKCHLCGKMYVSMPALSMHILTHNLSHKCELCGKAFSRPWLLQGHLRSHTGQKPYSCSICKKSFADRSNLRAHMQTHSSSKNFQCTRCHKTFALKSYLNKHCESACIRGGVTQQQHGVVLSMVGSPPPMMTR